MNATDFMAQECGTDEELTAECRLLGTLMNSPAMFRIPIMVQGFCVPFHAAVYYTILGMILSLVPPEPAEVWERVKDHPDAESFGADHVFGLAAEATDPMTFNKDQALLAKRAFNRINDVFASVN